MNKAKILPVLVAILSAAAVTAAVVVSILSPDSFKKPYSFISTSGGSYVGRVYSVPFSSFIELRDGYIYLNATDESKSSVPVLLPLKNYTLWGARTFYINKDQILVKGRIDECSNMGVTLKINKDCFEIPVQPAAPVSQPDTQPVAPAAPKK